MKVLSFFVCVLILISCSDREHIQEYNGDALISEGYKIDGNKEGLWVLYKPNGDTSSTYLYNRGHVIEECVFTDNILEKRIFYREDKDDSLIQYYQTGEVRSSGLVNGQGYNVGIVKFYYPDGSLDQQMEYIDGNIYNFIEYYPSGYVRITADTVAQGVTTIYDSSGIKIMNVIFKGGLPVDTLFVK